MTRSSAALDFLLTRRSRPAKLLGPPHPSRADLAPLLRAALRAPDHGKLEPWRLIVVEAPALKRLAGAAAARGAALGLDAETIEKGVAQFRDSGLAVVVVSAPVISEKIPQIEQIYSAGAVCLQLLNAALAAGWGANWLTGWPAHDRAFVENALALTPEESVAGIIHLGTARAVPPERPRPEPALKVAWLGD